MFVPGVNGSIIANSNAPSGSRLKGAYKNSKKRKMPNGGLTSLTPKEETEFQKFYKTLPSNLQSDTSQYDIRGYWDSLKRPIGFDYSQRKEDDGLYHAYSRHPQTGKMLKAMDHPTASMAIRGDKAAGYSHAMDPLGNVYSFSPNDLPTAGPFKVQQNTPTYPLTRMDNGGKVDHSNDKDMVNGVASILRRVESKPNRLKLANQLSKQFNREKVKYDLTSFLAKSKVKK